MAKALMFLGTSSESGKSVLATAFCRILKQRGISAAPFKAQNMALNSGVTPEGKEMGRAQIVQAEAACIEPHVDMNPILLKPTSEQGSQVVVHGVVHGNMDAADYYRQKKSFWRRITESYDRLAGHYDVIVLEGAGSPVEVNLKENDIVNMAMAEYADASAVLVADIDRGGVFASIIGTMELLQPAERKRLIGFIINKFRGDQSLLRDGLQFIKQKTGRPVFGVLPLLRSLYIPGEDSVSLDSRAPQSGQSTTAVTVGIIRLPHLANYTDFDPLLCDPRFSVEYVTSAQRLMLYDVVIIPGSKNVFHDTGFLCERGFQQALLRYHANGGRIVGICGGFQMLGISIRDPHGVESNMPEITALGFLPAVSTMRTEKVTRRVRCMLRLPGQQGVCAVAGYEIHMGATSLLDTPAVQGLTPDTPAEHAAGVASADGRVWGTYIHGIFDSDAMRDSFLMWAAPAGIGENAGHFSYAQFKEKNYDMLARAVEDHIDVAGIFRALGVDGGAAR
jgi:adenosylcobyric acid synthase